MECLDSSIVVKWFKIDEKFCKEAYDLYDLAKKKGAPYAANEWVILEVVRGLAKSHVPTENLRETCAILEQMFLSGSINRITVAEVFESAKEVEIDLNLHAADAVHLASAIETNSSVLWTADDHLHRPSVKEYARQRGVEIRGLG
jgi:predicted nucleic acid-binding protein